MNTIHQNYSTFIKMMFETLDRKETTDLEARNNYKSVLMDYCQFLYKLSPLPSIPEFVSQQNYLVRLDTLLQRYKNIGSDFIEDSNLETFLITLQNNMRDYIHQNLETKIYEHEKKYYSNLAWEANNYTHINRNTHDFQNEQQNAIERLIAKGPNFMNKPKIEGMG